MYLKSIEMQGFKSFADKTKVVFDKGVTAVVGPNGSGKSNITESLRWALGESSAKSLRGGKMPDVIFAGTEVRKALNYAEVAVTLDNSDGFIAGVGETIRVERHIYRNGDNDYLIDGRKVRLRDIHDLFMDTGLGRDSFSIISQGRVEAIFNAKPEERRAIFEEAAGVLGASRTRIFWKIIFPEIRPAVFTGFGLAFGRCLGEYGSVVFIAGNKPYETEITPLIIMSELQEFDYKSATAIALVMLAVSFLLLFVINLIQARNTKILKGG